MCCMRHCLLGLAAPSIYARSTAPRQREKGAFAGAVLKGGKKPPMGQTFFRCGDIPLDALRWLRNSQQIISLV